ncbi:hypothetical protein CBQ28_17110 [Pseudoalteromonas sp. GCY]|nr:hypothetical protein CBQ28_17110 [Pseudoalteromonas sp. GCY]
MISAMNRLKLFQSTDVGAPSGNNSDAGTVDVLKKVLVDGYGEVSPAGWSAPFSSTNSIVLKTANDDYFFKVYPAVNYSKGLAIHGYDAMTTINDGVNRMPDIDSSGPKYSPDSVPTMPKLSANWTILANEYCCYVLSDNGICAFIGSLDSKGAAPNCITGGFHGWDDTRMDRGFPFGADYHTMFIRAMAGREFIKLKPNHYILEVSKIKPVGEKNLIYQCGITIDGTEAFFPGMFGALFNSINDLNIEGYQFFKYHRTGSWNSHANGEVYLCLQ